MDNLKAEYSKFAYELSYSQLRGQKEDLKSLRNQASYCAAITGLVATIFASFFRVIYPEFSALKAGEGIHLPLAFWLIFGSVLVSIILSSLVLVGRGEYTFELNPDAILHAITTETKLPDLHAKLAKDADEFFDENERKIGRVRWLLGGGLFAAVFQVPLWIFLILEGVSNV
ncbi:hypothetical protein [Limimaricola cinnabarinus]|uniref:hypothetical protein n=1 Tax=Limimaricola cinnabarinus TaxID=1125964 RepID=UPI0013A67CCD|nr:hypothetical protein [Limimaricola cinnabarinus]